MDKKELKEIIIMELGIGALASDVQDKILEKLGANIIKRLTLAVLKNLPEKAKQEFEKLSEAGDEIKLREFLKSAIPDFEKLTQRTIKETIDEYKEIAGLNKIINN